MASGIYSQAKYDWLTKAVSMTGDTINVALMAVGHSFTASNTIWSNVSANEATNTSGSGYTAGGAALGTKAVTAGATTKFTAANTTWTTCSITAYFAVIYDITVSNHLIASIDFGGAVTSTNGTFQITWDAAGIIQLT